MGKRSPKTLGEQRAIDDGRIGDWIVDQVYSSDDVQRSRHHLNRTRLPQPRWAPDDGEPVPARQSLEVVTKELPVSGPGSHRRSGRQDEERWLQCIDRLREPGEPVVEPRRSAKWSVWRAPGPERRPER